MDNHFDENFSKDNICINFSLMLNMQCNYMIKKYDDDVTWQNTQT